MKPEHKRTRIAVDAMGSDAGVDVVVRGAIVAAREMGESLEIILVGDQPMIWEVLEAESARELPLFVAHAREQVEMAEKARHAFRSKPDSSIAVCANLVQTGRAEALVSAGNTAAVVTTSLLSLGRMRGIKRPAIASLIPTSDGQCVILDVGANADCKPFHLYQFGLMGRMYARVVLGVENPRV
jgi:glycerol-3-phosphate acyltransferase PlsX